MPQKLSDNEIRIAKIAADTIVANGGSVTFNEYDEKMFSTAYFTPLEWASIGWGLDQNNKKRNSDKLAVFAACRAGFVESTKDGYKIKESHSYA